MVSEIRCVIVVDPLPDKVMPLVDNLSRYGYAADVCRPEAWVSHVAGSAAAAMVIGPNMLSLQLWTFCQEVREQADLPVIVLGNAPSPDQVALVLEGGADACLQADQTLSARQVVAAIRAVERRRQLSQQARSDIIEAGGLRVDLARKDVTVEGRHIALTPTEFGILAVLSQQPGRVLSSVEILRQVHGYEADASEAQDIVKVHISRLRQKLEEDPQSPRMIVNVRGQGYIYMFERRAETTVH